MDLDKNKHEVLPLLFGDSLVAHIPKSFKLVNRGISGMTAFALKYILEERVISLNPHRVALHIGANDLRYTVMSTPEDIVLNVKEIFSDLIQALPDTKFYLISTLPCVDDLEDDFTLTPENRMNDLHTALNLQYQDMLEDLGVGFLDFNKYLLNENGSVKKEYYVDSLHLNETGYNYLLECFERDY